MTRVFTQKDLLGKANFVKNVGALYTAPIADVAERYSALTEGLTAPVRFFSGSGRAELVGNHTDHNHGLVIATTVDLDVVGAVNATADNSITVNSVGYPAFTVSADDLTVDEKAYGTSDALVKGIVKGFLDRGRKVGGFVVNTHSNIFKGAGVSSSAAFELLICEILNALYNNKQMDFVEKAIISQYAENVYFGKPSGLMDQLTISRGGVSFMDFNDPSMPMSSSLPWTFDSISAVIVNCGGDHCNLTGEYSAIRTEMNAVAETFGKKVLRGINKSQLIDNAKTISEKCGGRAFLRALHYADENARVMSTKYALESDDAGAFLANVTDSGMSSYTLLQNCYPSGDTEQRIPLALALASNHPDVLAYRVHGGGFAGTVLCFVEKKNSENFVNYMKKVFGGENVFAVSVRKFGATEVEA